MKQTPLRLILAIVGLIAAAVAVLRSTYYQPVRHERSGFENHWLDKGFEVAVVWPYYSYSNLPDGVSLALEEIDHGTGPLAGQAGKLAHKIHLRMITEPQGEAPGGPIARDIATHRSVLAVIGHESSTSAIQASVTYENHGILFLTPKSSDVRLTDHGFTYLFRLTPNDSTITDAMAAFAQSQGWHRVGILYGRNEHGETASGLFLSHAKERGLVTPFFRSYLEDADWVNQDLRPLVGELRGETFDALMLADRIPWATKLLVDRARMGMLQPVLATDKLDSNLLWQIAQIAANNVYVASAVDPESKEPEYLSFRQRFIQRYHSEPGYGASQGYEAFLLYARAVLLSDSADPVVVATTLRESSWRGLFGDFTFADNGDVVGRSVSIKRMQDGAFHTVSTIID